MRFTKMHGLGNDFMLVDDMSLGLDAPKELAVKLCARRFGVGADGLILAQPSDQADARMRVFNRDGSEAEMCGNGIRCLGKFLYDEGICRKPSMTIETLAGVLRVDIEAADGTAQRMRVDMGAPRFAPADIPVDAPENVLTLDVGGQTLRFFCVGMGNPHAVTFDLYPDDDAFARLGPLLESHPVFPRRANIEFCRVTGGGADVRVWERGDGPTLACGTGACAVLAAGASQGFLPRRAGIRLAGGVLDIEWAADGHLFMSGPAETVYDGELR